MLPLGEINNRESVLVAWFAAAYKTQYIQCESTPPRPPEDLWQFFQNGWEFLNQILHAYYAFLSTLEYGIICNFDEVMPWC